MITFCGGRFGEYWPEVVTVGTKRSEVRAKTIEGQYSPVRLEQANIVISLFNGSWRNLFIWNLPAFANKYMRPMTVSVETIHMENTEEARTNQNGRFYFRTTLPYNNSSY